jgi:hypothetical protein
MTTDRRGPGLKRYPDDTFNEAASIPVDGASVFRESLETSCTHPARKDEWLRQAAAVLSRVWEKMTSAGCA